MARHGSVGAFSGFSVCQPALGAALQWLPAIGTPELDHMINTFLPGPASIQDKRAHIAMDFFEYSRQTGENFKFYPVPSASFTPVTASPATSVYDSGYASSFNHSPVLSDNGSWTQSPAPFAPAASDARAKSRSSGTKKSSTSSSRQGTVDFSNHPGMRILTKDGRDVTNSASRGCKTKEQRDHAHLMRIIKACDSCRRKKVRCDPSHRKRNASQASASVGEQKPAKRPKKVEESPPIAAADATTDLLAAHAFDASEATLSFSAIDAGFSQDFDDFWNDVVTFDEQQVTAAAEPSFDDFVFDSFSDLQNFSPSSGSSSTSPSQTFTPFTPARSGASPNVVSDSVFDAPGEFSVDDPTVPYLNPGVAHGTNYVDFNLYSPGPEVFDEDPVLQLRDLASRQQSPQSEAFALEYTVQNSPRTATTNTVENVSGSQMTSTGEPSGGESLIVTASPGDLAWYYDPGSSLDGLQRDNRRSPTKRRQKTNHNRLVGEEGGARRSSTDGQSTSHLRLHDAHGSDIPGPVQSSVSRASSSAALCGSPCRDTASTVFARVSQSSVSPSPSPRPRRIDPAPVHESPSSPGGSAVSTNTTQPGFLSSPVDYSLPTVTASSPARHRSRKAVGDGVTAVVARYDQSCVNSTVSRQLPAGCEAWSSPHRDRQHVVQQDSVVAVNAVLATILSSTLPTRRNVAVDDVKINLHTLFFQLAVFGLVSLLCASAALQAHLASQVNLVNILAIAFISLGRFAPWCSGSSSATQVASKTLPSPTSSGMIDSVKSKIQAVVTESSRQLRCAVSQRARNIVPSLVPVRSLRF
ncbi:hypothetical protein C8A03DRAFT_42894 [Achaetomium macrosporum]|uniref:Zn(2)-C6 fungal-type domain-containing protein n=1 Tax=Achaetomium macrosporum TaxID=79813 RepID=A0AAN7CCH0_9PEZI|nr:hypothetical protein C8A03DRAFT_42894 [Achaetomium macrosporum]